MQTDPVDAPRTPRSLIGRAAELDLLSQAFRRARSGQPTAILLCGEAGIGKTRLLQEFLASPDLAEAKVLTGGCVEFGSAVMPFALFVELLRQVLSDDGADGLPRTYQAALGALVPGLTVTSAPDTSWPPDQLGQARLFGLALTLFQRLAERAPLVLVLEDIHWADATSLDLLRFLLVSLRDRPVLVLASYRSDALERGHPLSRLLADVTRQASVQTVPVPPLCQADLRSVITPMVNDAELAARLAERAEGNPFFAEELAANAGDSEVLPRRLLDTLLARLVALPDDVQHLLRVAAVVGGPVPDELLLGICGLPFQRYLPALRTAVDQQLLVVVTKDCYQFRHALFQHAVYGDLLAGERRHLHAAVAEALDEQLASGPPATLTATGQLAYHWYESGRTEPAFWAGLRAARVSASVFAFAEADTQYARVLQLSASLPDAPLDCPPLPLLLEAAEAARRAGATDRAISLVEEAMQVLDGVGGPADRASVLERLGQCQWEAGRTDQARESYEAAARALTHEPASELRARVLAAHARVLMVLDDFAASQQLCSEALAVARASGATGAATNALITFGVDQAMTGDLDGGLTTLKSACTAAAGSARLDDLVRAYGNLAAVLSRAARNSEALDAAFEGLDRLTALGLPLCVGGLLVVNAVAPLVWLGRWDEANRLAEEALSAGVPALHAAFLRQALAEVATLRGDFASAQRHVAAVGELSSNIGEWQFITSFSATVAELRGWQRDHDAARTAVAEGLKRTGGHQEDFTVLLCAAGLRAEADEAERRRWQRQDVSDVAEAADHLIRTAGKSVTTLEARHAPLDQSRLGLAQCRAELTRLIGASDPVTWQQVAEGWSRVDRVHAAAYASFRAAEAWLEHHSTDQAREALASARRAAERIGATPLRDEIDALARRARLELVDRPVASPSRPDIRTLLTEREREVVRLLVLGSTNREIGHALFISEKTAGVHVSNILGKLQARNRVEAAAAALRLGLVDTPTP